MKKLLLTLKSRKGTVVTVSIGVCVLLIVFAMNFVSAVGANETVGLVESNLQEEVIAVETQIVSKSTLEDDSVYSGSIAPTSTVNVMSSISGKVAAVYYDVGDRVNAGDILFAMDTNDIQDSINIAKASASSANASIETAQTNLELANGSSMQLQIENAKNAVSSAKTGVENAKIALNNTEIALSNTETALEKARNSYNKNQILFNAGAISQTDLDNSKRELEQSENAYYQAQNTNSQAVLSLETAEAALQQSEYTYGITANVTPDENIKKAQASLKQAIASSDTAQAQLASNQKKLEDAKVKSPISGIVLECNATEGAQLQSGAAHFVIIDLDTVNVEVNVAENMINTIIPGSNVKISVASVSNDLMAGTVRSIAPGANSDGTYRVSIEIPNHDSLLKSGMFAEVYFTKSKADNAVVVPASAVLMNKGVHYVYIVENEMAKRIDVTIGIEKGGFVEIKEGLTDGMSLIIAGQSYVKDGIRVHTEETK